MLRPANTYGSVPPLNLREMETMLSGSALIRVAILVVVAAMLAALVQIFWPSSRIDSEAEVTAASPPAVSSAAPPLQDAPRPTASPQAAPLPPSQLPPPVSAPALSPAPPVERAPPAVEAPPPDPAALPSRQGGASVSADASPPPALSVVDLNTASLEELNGLQGGGAIGKAIIRARPYSSVDQLLSKRVLSKGTYQRIKDQVTVR